MKPEEEVTLPFGRFKGRLVTALPDDHLEWPARIVIRQPSVAKSVEQEIKRLCLSWSRDQEDETDFEVIDEDLEDPESLHFLKVEIDPAELLELSEAEIADAIGQVALMDTQLRLRLMEILGRSAARPDEGDRLLTVAQAAEKLSVSKERLYKHPKEFRSFEVSFGRTVRFSERAIEAWIARRKGVIA